MKSLNNLSEGKFDSVEIGAITLCGPTPSTTWKLVLPPNDGDPGQVLTTDGNGVTTWTGTGGGIGTVTSVALSAPSFLTVSGSPVEDAGTLTLSYSGTPLPVANGGTGVTTSTGTGSVVLSAAPTFSGVVSLTGRYEVNVSGTECARMFRTTNGDVFYAGTSLGGNTAMKMAFFETTPSTDNYFQLGFFGGIDGTIFRADGNVEMHTGGDLLIKSATNTTTIKSQANTDWTLGLPINGGIAGYVLSTDGSGGTSWVAQTGGGPGSGTVTSVQLTTGTGLSQTGIAGDEITTSGTFTIEFTSPTGTGANVVLQTSPSLITPDLGDTALYLRNADTNHGLEWNVTSNGPRLFGFEGGRLDYTNVGGTSLLWDSAGITLPDTRDLILTEGSFTTTITCGATSNWTLKLPVDDGASGQILTTNGSGVTSWVAPVGGGSTTGTGAAVLQTSPSLITPTISGTAQIAASSSLTLNSSPIYIKNDVNHGLEYSATPDGPRLFGFGGGQLDSTAGTSMTWGSVGITLPNTRDLIMTKGANATTIKCGSIVNWDLTLPPNTGTTGQFLKTDGNGVTSWDTPGLPIDPVPVVNGGTGVTTSTGSTSVVLSNAPTFTGQVIVSSGSLVMSQQPIYLNNAGDTNHGLQYTAAAPDGPKLWGFAGGKLAYGNAGATEVMNWDSGGINVSGTIDVTGSVYATPRGEMFYKTTSQIINDSSTLLVTNFTGFRASGIDRLTSSGSRWTNNLGYTVMATFHWGAIGGGLVDVTYFFKFSANSIHEYASNKGASSFGSNGSSVFVMNDGDYIEFYATNHSNTLPFAMNGGASASQFGTWVNYLIN